MSQMGDIEGIEKRLWSSADNLRANSNFSSNEYFLPVMGLIFLRHAYSRYLKIKPEIEATLPRRDGKTRPSTKEDFSGRGAIYLRNEAQYEYLVNLSDADDRAEAIMNAMEVIEDDYESLKGILPKREYQELDNDVLGTLLRTFNDSVLRTATGDVFGRIYEYFLTGFADQNAHDGGEFFTPVSLVQMIVNVIEPDHGKVIDPACGSGGMFVQSAHFIERAYQNPQEVATFYGMEKNPTTIRLAKMNLAVHGLEGKVTKAISYYEDPHELVRKCDFVMANPPFNVDKIDASKIKNDPRLPFDLPGVNKKGQVSNGNYVWISLFYSYLNDAGRAGFVMSSQASSAGGEEAKIRRKVIETGHVDAMIAIRSNFFYTRSVPCELWFLNKNKPESHKKKVLMVDARNIFREATRTIYDFSHEQTQNLTAIFWLYGGQRDRFLKLVERYLQSTVDAALTAVNQLSSFFKAYDTLAERVTHHSNELKQARDQLESKFEEFAISAKVQVESWVNSARDNDGLHAVSKALVWMVTTSRYLVEQIDQVFKLIQEQAKSQKARGLNQLIKNTEYARGAVVEALQQISYFHEQSRWLQKRFPNAQLRNIEGLVKLVDHRELEKNDWSLTPSRYVGVAPQEELKDFNFEESLRKIHLKLAGLNEESIELAAKIENNFKELGI